MSTDIRGAQSSAFWRGFRKSLPGFMFILPTLALFIVFRIWPTINGLLLSFQDYRINGDSTWVGLEHFRYLLQDDLFWHSLRVTMAYAVIAVPLSTVSALGMAL